jgi:hypothetical protein
MRQTSTIRHATFKRANGSLYFFALSHAHTNTIPPSPIDLD